MDRKQHWEEVYQERKPDAVSWYQLQPEPSLSLIRNSDVNRDAPIIDVGGGASNLVDHLLETGYFDLTVLDLSESALQHAQQRLGERARGIEWVVTDITRFSPPKHYAVWHDRAVLHFLTAPEDQSLYLAALDQATQAGSHVIIGTFGLEGPKKCSGLEVVRYSSESLQQLLGHKYQLLTQQACSHQTPWDAEQQFLFCHFRRRDS